MQRQGVAFDGGGSDSDEDDASATPQSPDQGHALERAWPAVVPAPVAAVAVAVAR